MLTLEQLEQYQSCFADPLYFINKFFKVRHPHKINGLQFSAYPIQEQLINHFKGYSHVINLGSRQCGLTIITAGYILWRAIFKRHTILIGSPKRSQSKDIMNIMQFALDMLPKWMHIETIERNNRIISFENEGKILTNTVGLNFASGVRCDLVYIFEAAFIPHNILLDTWESILPIISYKNEGDLILQSSGNVADSLFDKWWEKSNKDSTFLSPFLVKWDDIPNRNEQFKKSMIEIIGIKSWNAEFELVS